MINSDPAEMIIAPEVDLGPMIMIIYRHYRPFRRKVDHGYSSKLIMKPEWIMEMRLLIMPLTCTFVRMIMKVDDHDL